MRVLILSGGGAGLFAYGGAYQALKERGWVPDVIAGTSAGALAGALIACGREDRIAHYAKTLSGDELWGMGGPKLTEAIGSFFRLRKTRGLVNPAKLHAIIDGELHNAVYAHRFEAYAVDVLSGVTVIGFSEETDTNIVDYVKGSMALPLIFPPQPTTLRGGQSAELRDGGVTSNHPTLTALVEHRQRAKRLEAGGAFEDWECLILSALDPYDTKAIKPGIGGVMQEVGRVIATALHDQARAARNRLENHGVPFKWVNLKTDIDLLGFTKKDALRVWTDGYHALQREGLWG